ncbi:MAG TPA: Gfo/Idh/MocA family oxidoreductase [Bryobacteraceae bacterium]|nr:Gfo/Idh/MocA family oxidoreductase [Bryobacteraceae bacterium]
MKPQATRRSFLSAGAAAAGAFTIVAPRSVRGSQANSQVAIGLIGCGGRGSFDGSIVNADPRAKVMALCDKFPDQFDKSETTIKSQDTRKYTDFEKLLGASDIDAVFIATPPFEHPRMLEAAIQARKHIYCEKPIGVDVEGVKRAIAAGRKADKTKTIFVGFQQRYGPEYLEAYRRIQHGAIGELSNARGFWISSDPFTRKPYSDTSVEKLRNWFAYHEYSGDIIVEQDCHNLDVLHWFLGGLPVSAVGRGNKKVRKNMDILDNLTVIYQWPNGFFVNFEANQLTPRGFSRVGEEFTGTKGTIATSRARMTHYKGPGDSEEMPTKRDITIDAIEDFVTRIVNNDPDNVVERSALSTCIALLGRTAIYSGREATWKGDIGIAAG